jgi:hypothetical protein
MLEALRYKRIPIHSEIFCGYDLLPLPQRSGICAIATSQNCYKRNISSPLFGNIISMSRLSQLLLSSLRSSVHSLLRPASPTIPGFHNRISHLRHFVEKDDDAAASLALNELRSRFPRPPVQVIPKRIWTNEPNCLISVQTHLKSTFADAVNLLTATGRQLSVADEKYLRLLLTHVCGWSATYPSHVNDSWVNFFHVRYPQLQGLVPILDSMTYPEELADFPDDYNFPHPRFCLLATSERFFIWDASDWGEDGLFIAGDTLEEVYTGLRDWKWAESYEDVWEMVDEDRGEYLHPGFYFVTYKRKKNGNFSINGSTEEIPGKRVKGLLDRF